MNLAQYVGKPEQIQRIKRACCATLGSLVVVDFFLYREHVAFLWDGIPGFSAFYGFISTVLIILVSKFVGHVWLMKPEDYYD